MSNTLDSKTRRGRCRLNLRSNSQTVFQPIRAIVAIAVLLGLGPVAAAATSPRFTAVWDDDTLRSGDSLGPWYDGQCQPELAGRPLFNARNSVRWVRDNALAPAKDPDAFVEFWIWDRLPGQVIALANESASSAETLPPHLLVAPALPIDRPNNKSGAPATNLPRAGPLGAADRVAAGRPGAYRPSTVFYRDGRQSSYRRLRFSGESIRLLRDEGVEDVPLSAIAELHFPAADAWDAHFEQLAALDPDGKARIMQLETAQGLRSHHFRRAAFRPSSMPQHRRPDRDQNPERRWYHRVQPVWSVDPLWLPYGQIRLRRMVSAASRAAFLFRARGQPPAIDPGRGLAMDGRPQRAGHPLRGGRANLRLGLRSPGDQRIGISAA